MLSQYNFFKSLYDEENIRAKYITEKGKVYISIITFYLGVLFFKTSDFLGSNTDSLVKQNTSGASPEVIFYFLTVVLMVSGFFFSVYSLGIFKYESLNDPESILEDYNYEIPDEKIFFKGRIADTTISTKRNMLINNKRAKLLRISSICMIIGMVSHVLSYALFLF